MTDRKLQHRNLFFARGQEVKESFTIVDTTGTTVNLEGLTARAIFREKFVAGTEPGLVVNDLVVHGPEGQVDLLVTGEQTQALTLDRGRYQVEVVSPDGTTIVLVTGDFDVDLPDTE